MVPWRTHTLNNMFWKQKKNFLLCLKVFHTHYHVVNSHNITLFCNRNSLSSNDLTYSFFESNYAVLKAEFSSNLVVHNISDSTPSYTNIYFKFLGLTQPSIPL